MELRQLEYFVALCEEMHFTRAAQKLNISQPSLSQQMNLLEHELGEVLFDHIGKRNVLTKTGQILLEHSYNIFNELSKVKFEINKLQNLESGQLKIGSVLTVIDHLLAPTVVKFHGLHPNIKITLQGLRTEDVYNQLLDDKIDFGVVFLPTNNKNVDFITVYNEEVVLVAPLNKNVNSAEITLEDLQKMSTILFPKNYFLRQLIDEYCKNLNIDVKPIMEMTTIESIVQMVEKNMGVTLLPKSYINHIKNKNIKIIPVNEPSVNVEIGVIYLKNKTLCSASKIFIGQLLQNSTQERY